jgi:AraC family transcriptional regulator
VRVGLVYLRPRQVGFIRANGVYQTSSIQAWGAMTDWLERHNLLGQTHCGYGLALDDPREIAPELCRYDACVEVPTEYEALKTDGLAFQTLPGGAFARMRHIGSYARVRSSILKVRDQWLPEQNRLQLDRRRPLLVVYLDAPGNTRTMKLRCDVCIPVRTHYEDAVKRQKFTDAEVTA